MEYLRQDIYNKTTSTHKHFMAIFNVRTYLSVLQQLFCTVKYLGKSFTKFKCFDVCNAFYKELIWLNN